MNDAPLRQRVLSPGVIVGFVDGTTWVHCGKNNQVYSSPDPGLLVVLANFLTPSALKGLTSPDTHSDILHQHVEQLARIGALVDCDEACAVEPMLPASCDTDPLPGDLIQSHLGPLALALDALSTTLAAIGPEVADSLARETGIGLKSRLMACTAGIIGIRKELEKRIPDWVETQLRQLNVGEKGISLHLGAGSAELAGWINVDVWPAQLSLDLRRGLPFADGSVERVYLSHTLEHLWYPGEVIQLLKEALRVLAPSGRIRIVVPDIELAIHAYVENDRRFFEGRDKTSWPEWNISTRMESFLGYAGVGPHPGMFAHAHKYGYDFETVAHVLGEAGFREIRGCSFQGSADPMMLIDDVSSYAGAQVDGRYYSLFVEAVR
jgi:predicted SAM-dependent methyltransferase